MKHKTRTWHWVLAGLLGFVTTIAGVIACTFWYFASGISFSFVTVSSGEMLLAAASQWQTAVIPALIVIVLAAGSSLALTRMAGRKVGLTFAFICAVGYVTQIGATIWQARTEVPSGASYVGTQPVSLLVAALTMLLPALAAAAIACVSGRGNAVLSD